MTASLAFVDGQEAAPSQAVPEVPQQPAEPQRLSPDPGREALLARIRELIADIDRRLGRQLDAILHHPAFQRMEARWRGLHWLASGITDPKVRLRILDIK